MQVEFKLTTAQQKLAAKIAARVSAEWDEIDPEEVDDYFNQGNLVGAIWGHSALNRNQSLNLSANGRQAIYEGERHPLKKDGGLAALLELGGYWVYDQYPQYEDDKPLAALQAERAAWTAASKAAWEAAEADNWAALEVVAYETSDGRLRWWETLDSYMSSRASLGEVLESQTAWDRLTNGWAAEFALPNLERFGILQGHVVAALGGQWARLGAEMDSQQLKLLRRLAHVLSV